MTEMQKLKALNALIILEALDGENDINVNEILTWKDLQETVGKVMFKREITDPTILVRRVWEIQSLLFQTIIDKEWTKSLKNFKRTTTPNVNEIEFSKDLFESKEKLFIQIKPENDIIKDITEVMYYV